MSGHLRYALRQFRLSPVFTAAAILTLALGIGGTTAIFTLMHAVMLRSLPVADPALLYRGGDGDDCCVESGPQNRWGMFSLPLYERLRAATPEFEDVAAFQAARVLLSVRREGAGNAAKPLRCEYVTGNYFRTLGISAFGGRLLSAKDDRRSSAPVIVISHHLWQTGFGSDSSVLGTTFVVEGHAFTVIGITPPGFFGETLRGDPPDVWLPTHQEPLIAGGGSLLEQPASAWLRMIGRLHPGASIAGMDARLTIVLRQWIEHDSGYPASWMADVVRLLPRQIVNVVPAGAGVAEMKEEYGRSLQILLAVCGTVLLIACANVANLLLARAVARRGQIALRLAIGANRRQIVGQALLEAMLLAVGGAVAGLGVAVLAGRLLLRLAFGHSHFLPISTLPSPAVLGFTFGMALLTGILFGAAPAWFATRTNPVEALRSAGRSTSDHSSFSRKALLILQVALSVVLVSGSIMLARSLNQLEHQSFGYQTEGRVVVSLNHPSASYTQPQLMALYRRMEEGLNSLPGVKGSGLALYNPLTDNWGEIVLVDGHPPPRIGDQDSSSWDRVSTRYLQNLGMSLLRGRYFTDADNERTEQVAIVNEAFTRRYFRGGEDPLGHLFGLDVPANARTFRIVGIAQDAKFAPYNLSRPARPMFYVPLTQSVDYKEAHMKRVEMQSHFIGGIMLVTNTPPGTLEPLLTRRLAGIVRT